jgi:hypothetical protein
MEVESMKVTEKRKKTTLARIHFDRRPAVEGGVQREVSKMARLIVTRYEIDGRDGMIRWAKHLAN